MPMVKYTLVDPRCGNLVANIWVPLERLPLIGDVYFGHVVSDVQGQTVFVMPKEG